MWANLSPKAMGKDTSQLNMLNHSVICRTENADVFRTVLTHDVVDLLDGTA